MIEWKFHFLASEKVPLFFATAKNRKFLSIDRKIEIVDV